MQTGAPTVLHPENMLPATLSIPPTIEALVSATTSPNSILKDDRQNSQSISSFAMLHQLLAQPNIPYQAVRNAVRKGLMTMTTTLTTSGFNWSLDTHKQICAGKSVHLPQLSGYRRSLCAILAMICLLHTAENHEPTDIVTPRESCRATLVANHKRALQNAFREGPLGIQDAVQPNYDIIVEIRNWRTKISSRIVTVHEKLISKPLGLASESTSHKDHPPPILLNTTIISVMYRGNPIVENLKGIITDENYRNPLQAKLQKDNQWDDDTYNHVSWKDYNNALQALPRSQRISITKMSHQFWNTNQQNFRYYGQDCKCPLCEVEDETLHHIYCCQHESAVVARQLALETLRNMISKPTLATLLQIIDAAMTQETQGHSEFTLHTWPEEITEAIDVQSKIGWGPFLRGHVATQWRSAYNSSVSPKQANSHRRINK